MGNQKERQPVHERSGEREPPGQSGYTVKGGKRQGRRNSG